MAKKTKPDIAIIGAGIAGLTAAYMLQELNYSVSVFEAHENVRGLGAGLGLASNAISAFDYLGLKEEVVKISHPLPSFKICDAEGKPLFSVDTQRIKKNLNADNYAVHRADLHQLLTEKLGEVSIFTQKKLSSLRSTSSKVRVQFDKGTQKEFDYVIGADGVNSQVRQCLWPQSIPRYAGYWCWRHVVKTHELSSEGSFACWGRQGRFGITPLSDNRVYWFACLNAKKNDGVAKYKLGDLQKQFKTYMPIIPKLLALSGDNDLISGPIVDIDPLKKFYRDRVLLIGDAAHATTPNMGQGACMAVEDVSVLKDELKRNKFHLACQNFEKRRKDRTAYMIKSSKRVGQIAQLNHPIWCGMRNLILRNLPDSWIQQPIKRLLDEDYMAISVS